MSVHSLESRKQAKARGKQLAAECKTRLTVVNMIIDELAAEVTPLVEKYGELRAVNTRLGTYTAGPVPDVRQVIADRLHARLGALRPHIPFVTDPDKE